MGMVVAHGGVHEGRHWHPASDLPELGTEPRLARMRPTRESQPPPAARVLGVRSRLGRVPHAFTSLASLPVPNCTPPRATMGKIGLARARGRPCPSQDLISYASGSQGSLSTHGCLWCVCLGMPTSSVGVPLPQTLPRSYTTPTPRPTAARTPRPRLPNVLGSASLIGDRHSRTPRSAGPCKEQRRWNGKVGSSSQTPTTGCVVSGELMSGGRMDGGREVGGETRRGYREDNLPLACSLWRSIHMGTQTLGDGQGS